MDTAPDHDPDAGWPTDFDLIPDVLRVRTRHSTDGTVLVQLDCQLPLDETTRHTVTVAFPRLMAIAMIQDMLGEIGSHLVGDSGDAPVGWEADGWAAHLSHLE